MPKKAPNFLNALRQRRRPFQMGSVFQRVASVTASPKETVPSISLSQPQTLPSL